MSRWTKEEKRKMAADISLGLSESGRAALELTIKTARGMRRNMASFRLLYVEQTLAELARYKAPLEICADCKEQRQDHPRTVDTSGGWFGCHEFPRVCNFEPSGNFADPEDLLP